MDEIIESMDNMSVDPTDNHRTDQMIDYVLSLDINYAIKQRLIFLIENDNIDSYIDIYNICIENEIELPPI